MDVDLLMNPKMGGMSSDIETVDIPTLTFDDVTPSMTFPETAAAPSLVPSFENTGPPKMDGLDNFNAEPYSSAAPRRVSEETLMKEKYEILRKFERLSKMGVPMRKRFTIDSPLEEMKMELEFIKREKSMDSTIKQFSEWFVTGMSAMEYGSKHVALLKAFGLQLDGLSESAQMNVVDLEEDFEELYDLYGENMKMHPLVRIPLRTCMMIYMVHLTNQMTRKSTIPNIDEIMRNNPDIARSLAAAAMQNQTQQTRASVPFLPVQQAPSNPLGGLMSFMQGGMTNAPPPPPNVVPRPPVETKPIHIGLPKRAPAKAAPAPPPAAVEMRAPPNIDELLRNIKQNVLPPPGSGPPPAEKVKRGSGKAAGSTGKNSVVIKL